MVYSGCENNLENNIEADDNVQEMNNIFDQKFKYLSKGCQTYVFQSEDKKYVIKFIRYHRYRTGDPHRKAPQGSRVPPDFLSFHTP